MIVLDSATGSLAGVCPPGKELYSKMVDEADDMIMAMEEGREVDILQEVMKYSGLEAEEH